MKKVYELKCCVSGLGNHNATEIYTIYVVCDTAKQAIHSVLKPETISVEVISVHHCFVLT